MAAESPRAPLYRRALLKLSGEALLGDAAYGVDPATALRFAREIKAASLGGTQICVVIGGGNIFRGMAGAASGMDRVKADYIGMLATVMNAVALGNALERAGAAVAIHSAIPVEQVGAELFQRDRALRDLAAGKIVIFAGGTGNPFFTTDTTAALRAAEMGCDVILKATQVDGVYSADPKRDPNAVRYERLTYDEALARNLKIMDGAAFALARDAAIPILVFCVEGEGSIEQVLYGELASTLVTAG
ncbi:MULTISPECIES: UMP kinase [Rhodomicrobium]|uniref:UMP kinase n=1 Tax=Rhodomicrobium TaxID=1068 RepID=UPI000B4B20D4|nr:MULTISPECIES: UMP kinase [Rhodomicrobium]